MHHQDGERRTKLHTVIPVGYPVQGIIRHSGKSKLLPDKITVNRISCGRQCTRAKRHVVHSLKAVVKPDDIAFHHIGVSHHIVAEGHRLRPLKMGIARHHRIKIFLRTVAELLHEADDQFLYLADFLFHIKAHIKSDLIIPGPCGMETLSRIPNPFRQNLFHGHMDIFIFRGKLNFSCLYFF